MIQSVAIKAFLAIVIYVVLRRIIKFLSDWYLDFRTQRALDGKYGIETRWVAEMIEDGDIEFCQAVANLPQWEMMEVEIVAESKSELRERTISRYQEHYE